MQVDCLLAAQTLATQAAKDGFCYGSGSTAAQAFLNQGSCHSQPLLAERCFQQQVCTPHVVDLANIIVVALGIPHLRALEDEIQAARNVKKILQETLPCHCSCNRDPAPEPEWLVESLSLLYL